jgi:hypothetical protein
MTPNPQFLIVASISVLYIRAASTSLRYVKNVLTLGLVPQTYWRLVWWIRAFLWVNVLAGAVDLESYFTHSAFREEIWVVPATYTVVMAGIFRAEKEVLHRAKQNQESDTTISEEDPLWPARLTVIRPEVIIESAET